MKKRSRYKREYYLKDQEHWKAYARNYYHKNKEKIKEYRLKNKEKLREYDKKYSFENKEKKRAYRLKNRERFRQWHKEYYQKNKQWIKEKRIKSWGRSTLCVGGEIPVAAAASKPLMSNLAAATKMNYEVE